ncbi:MAG: hypothetical protein R3D71_03610 [Rickettsiales bacterium]
MKISDIRNKLIKQTVIITLILIFISCIIWYLLMVDSDYESEINGLKTEVNNFTRNANSLAAEYKEVVGLANKYEDIQDKQRKNMLIVSKTVLRDKVGSIRSKYNLDITEVRMSGIVPSNKPEYNRQTSFIESSVVDLKMNTLSDLDVLQFIGNLSKLFSGVRINSLKMSVNSDIDNKVLLEVKSGGFFPVVKTELSFTLFGIRGLNNMDDGLTEENTNSSFQPTKNNSRIRLR